MYVCVLSVSSALSLKSFPPLLFQKKNIPKNINVFAPKEGNSFALKEEQKAEKKTERRFVPLCPAARARCSFLTAREGQKHFLAYQTGARKRRERESALFFLLFRSGASLFFSFFRPSFPRAKIHKQQTTTKSTFFFLRSRIKSAFERKIPPFSCKFDRAKPS